MDNYIEICGLRTHYRVEGQGPGTLLVMHGWGCTLDTVAFISQVAAQTHRVVSIDFPGFGQSDEPSEIWGIEMYTRFVEELVIKLGLDNLSLLGHSFGGRVGILYCSRHPEIQRLILVDAAGIKPRRSLQYKVRVYSFKFFKRMAHLLMPKPKADAVVNRWRSHYGSADYNNASPTMRGILSRVVNEDLKHKMPLIKAPTLLIWGENDTATPLKDARTMEKLIPDAGLVSFKGCGHYSFLDNPAQFAAVLNSFLNS